MSSPLAVFTCRSNSHPFQERQVPLDEPAKIGRSVARCRPSPNNVTFDCKVLSRNHALLYYEDGKFYLQDTKSSNGTFVNNQRLSKGSEESCPFEILSGDAIQFGVDVMENSRKVTHSCIISTIKLFLEDGTEARTRTEVSPSSLEKVLPTQANVCSQEMYQISQLLKEALHREQMLEQKLATLQRLLASTQEASENSWQALIDEDRLLSRLEVLEHQLQVYAVKSLPEESLRKELSQLLEDKLNYETTAKESLWRVLQEKLAAARKLAEHERALSNAEDECTHLREAYENAQEELSELASQYDDTRTQLADLGDKMKLSIEQQEILELEAGEEKQKLQSVISELKQREAALQACVEALQADTDFTREQLTAVKAKLEQMQEKRVKENPVIGGTVDEISSKMNGRIDEEHISTAGSDNCTDLLQQIIQFQIRLSRSADSNLLLDDEQKEAKAKLKALLDVAQKKLMFSNIEDESAAVNVKTDVQPVGLSPNKEVLKVRQDKMEHKLETAFKELDQLRGRKEMRETTINSEVVNVIDAVHAGVRIVPEVVVAPTLF
uniref:sarcolemmal membrane-associated protein-like n=1 Tax=Myxine glutinosa TaxID=7769 RepID=UPI00358DF6A3